MNEMYDCSGWLGRFGGVTEPDDGFYFSQDAEKEDAEDDE